MAHASDNREELARARAALALAAAGRQVAVVSGGDPGVFAMAAAVCEAVEAGPEEWRRLDIAVLPGVTAMLAVAARCGAPLGHDFCAISLSDNLKPWPVVEARLRAAAAAGFVIALYNPVSRARPWQLGRAFEVLREACRRRRRWSSAAPPDGTDERIVVVPLAEADGRDGGHGDLRDRGLGGDADGGARGAAAARLYAALGGGGREMIEPSEHGLRPTRGRSGRAGRSIITTGRPRPRAAAILP